MNKVSTNFWLPFSKQTNGTFIEGKYGQSGKVVFDYKGWSIVFDHYTLRAISGTHSYEQTYTRVTTLVDSIDDFKFEIRPQNFLDSVTKIFGSQDIKIGDFSFDKKFVVKSNNEENIKKLFLAEELKLRFENTRDFNLQIADLRGIWEEKLPNGKLELAYFEKAGKEDIDKLKSVGEIFKLTLDQLLAMRSICVSNLK